MKKWLILELEDNWKMIFPDEDIKPHSKIVINFNNIEEAIVSQDMSCPCSPKINFKDRIIIHNAFDGRL